MGKTRIVKRITAGRLVREVAYDRALPSDSTRARQAKRQHSSRARALMNHKLLWQRVQGLLLCNFSPGDLFCRLSYDDAHLPESFEAAQREARNFIRRLDRQCKKLGVELRYIYNTETLNRDDGRRLHHHLVIGAAGGAITEETIAGVWGRGAVQAQLLGDDPNYSDDFLEIAQYLTKERFPGTPGRKLDVKACPHSANLITPTEETFVIDDGLTISAPAGAKILDQDHIENEYGRFDYLLYLKPAPRQAWPPGADAKRK